MMHGETVSLAIKWLKTTISRKEAADWAEWKELFQACETQPIKLARFDGEWLQNRWFGLSLTIGLVL